MNTLLDPSPILQTAFGFWNSKVLLTGVEIGVFTKLSDRRLTAGELGGQLGLHPRGIKDFFDAHFGYGSSDQLRPDNNSPYPQILLRQSRSGDGVDQFFRFPISNLKRWDGSL